MRLFNRLKQSLFFRQRGLRFQVLKKYSGYIRHSAEGLLRNSHLRIQDSSDFTIACLVGKKQLTDLLFTLISFERATGSIGNLTVLSDGSLDNNDVKFLSKWHRNCRVFLDPVDLCQFYRFEPHLTLAEFYKAHYLAPKIFLLNAVQSQDNCILLDSDVIFFRNPFESNSSLVKLMKERKCFCLEDEWESDDPRIISEGQKNGLTISKRINTGLVYVYKSAFDSIDWRKHIPSACISEPHVFTEQSLIAAGLEVAGYSFLPKSEFLVSLKGVAFPKEDHPPFKDIDEPYENLFCRHFVSPVRYLMWLKAFPLLKDKL